jgi:hypothetical protein
MVTLVYHVYKHLWACLVKREWRQMLRHQRVNGFFIPLYWRRLTRSPPCLCVPLTRSLLGNGVFSSAFYFRFSDWAQQRTSNFSLSDGESTLPELLYDCQFTVNQLIFVPSPLRSQPEIYSTELSQSWSLLCACRLNCNIFKIFTRSVYPTYRC